MIKVQGKIPREVGVAVSGGIDSMVILDFLRRNHNVTVYNFDHGTKFGEQARELVIKYCDKHNIPYHLGKSSEVTPKGLSREEHWRNERYNWLKSFDQTIVVAHHLKDCLESYLFNMCNGKDYLIPYRHANCIRPFRLTDKDEIRMYAVNKKIPFLNDPCEFDDRLKRNFIRKELVPIVYEVNPGIYKVLSKRIAAEKVE